VKSKIQDSSGWPSYSDDRRYQFLERFSISPTATPQLSRWKGLPLVFFVWLSAMREKDATIPGAILTPSLTGRQFIGDRCSRLLADPRRFTCFNFFSQFAGMPACIPRESIWYGIAVGLSVWDFNIRSWPHRWERRKSPEGLSAYWTRSFHRQLPSSIGVIAVVLRVGRGFCQGEYTPACLLVHREIDGRPFEFRAFYAFRKPMYSALKLP